MKILKIYGEIGRDVLDTDFTASLQKITGDVLLKINSPGGSVFQGYAIYNALKEYNRGTITVHIDGVAASMASVICLAGDKIIMADNAMLMIHNPKSSGFGESKDLRKQANFLDKVKSVLMQTYAKKTGLKKGKLTTMLDDETWLDANEALGFGFIDEIKNETLIKVRNTHTTEPSDVFACYVINKPLNMNKKLLKLLELTDNATDEEVVLAVKKLIPKKKVKNSKEVENVIDEALRARKITADMTGHFRNMLKADFKGTKNLIGKMHGLPKLSGMIDGKSGKDNSKEDRSKWQLDDYRKHAPNELKRNPKLYNKLVEAEFKNEN